MATIITVHGTNATGPAEGDAWWQVGSAFEQALRKFVTATAGEINVTPLRWDGRNSEASRYGAGLNLARIIRSLEDKDEPYCLIGHSHGGSVIAHALGQLVYSGHPLNSLRRWLTVGTPFIEMSPRSLLFFRLHVYGVAAYVILLYLFFVWISFLLSYIYLNLWSQPKNPVFDISILSFGLVFLLIIYWALHWLQPMKLRLTQRLVRLKLRERIGHTWLALWHRGDEAIQGLRLLKDVRVSPFEKNFASPYVAFGSLLLLPLIMYQLSQFDLYDLLAKNITAYFPEFRPARDCENQGMFPPGNECADFFKQFARNNLAVIVWPAKGLLELLRAAGLGPEKLWPRGFLFWSVFLTGAAVGFAGLWVCSVLMYRVVLAVAGGVSAAISLMLNRFTRNQLLRLGYGSDTLGELARSAREHPAWLAVPFPPLPTKLEQEITQASDNAAAAAIGKLRGALGAITFSETDYAPGELVSRYLTWRELVHTNYFHSERLQKLVAYAIAQEDGFEATTFFLCDSDYSIVKSWYSELLMGFESAARSGDM